MEKRKIDFSKYADMHEDTVIAGKDGTEITVRDHIPYSEKEAMVTDMAEHLLMIHDDSCVFLSSTYCKYEAFMVAKYYTDIDTDDADYNEVADFLINNDMYGDVIAHIWMDFQIVLEMFGYTEASVTKTYEDDKCLTKALRTSFGFLFSGEDISESMAKAEATKDTLYEALDALHKADKEKEKQIDNGIVRIGGNMINFAKKTE